MSGKSVANKVVKAIDWDFVARAIVSDEGKRELASLKRTYDDVTNVLSTKLNQKVVPLDWELYKERLGPKIVDIFKNSYDSIKVPEYVDTHTPEFEKKHTELVTKATEQEEFSKKEVARLKIELQKLQEQKESLRTQTVDDYFSKNPEMKKEIDAEIKSQNWGY